MKCDKVSFHYRGTGAFEHAGNRLAEQLSNITVAYEYGEGINKTTVSYDLGSMLRQLAMKLDELQKEPK